MACGDYDDKLSLDLIRDSLIRQEDTIIFNLIERIKFPINSTLYKKPSSWFPDFTGSLFQYLFQETEALQSKVGRYLSPEENPFFPDNLPASIVPPSKCPPVLHPVAESININEKILDVYLNQLLPLFCTEADEGNYATTAACDIQLLQAISRRIHYGKFVAEVKFRDCSDEYTPLILAQQDRDALMKLLTFEVVEEMVKKRVAKKAMIFGQEVTLVDNAKEVKCKVDPLLVSRLYDEWIMPLTKHVQVEYLLRRLDQNKLTSI
uniref:Chorismate mutase 2 n=1 Tax=Petunia hybrida TaxID=4102 RepID=CM2_PETHY|nr:RecName: Full=Chorismate mutase 2; Short=PhCM2 [Petunia x hybrida]ACI41890.1 chorismate mutase 2 [Petunia x hybrida]